MIESKRQQTTTTTTNLSAKELEANANPFEPAPAPRHACFAREEAVAAAKKRAHDLEMGDAGEEMELEGGGGGCMGDQRDSSSNGSISNRLKSLVIALLARKKGKCVASLQVPTLELCVLAYGWRVT